MQTGADTTMGQIAALERLVPQLAKLEQLLAEGNEAQIAALARFAADPNLKRLRDLVEEQRSEFDALDFVGRLRLESGRALWGWEEFHSGVLAWLLDPKQSHGIGDKFLSGFLTRVGVQTAEHFIDWSTASVQQEWPNEVDGEWGYLDILILNESAQTLCAIENKVFSSEHSEQLTRYRKALSDSYPDFTKHHIFLTPRGTLPYREEERASWVPATYATVLNIAQQIVDDNSRPVKEDVRAFLWQYATTLRRNIVPETSIAQLARKIYMEHREAIELIIQHKPDFVEEAKEMFKAAIQQQDDWKLDRELAGLVGFRHAKWEKFDVFKTGTGWTSKALVLFDFDFREDGKVMLILTISPGNEESARSRLFEAAQRNPLFDSKGHSFGRWRDRYIRLHVSESILDRSHFDNWGNQESIRTKINEWVANFAENQFPAMNEVIINCLRESEAEQ